MYVCMYICVYVYVCIYIYTHTMYKIDNLMRTYSIAQGTLLDALWWPKWEANLKKRGLYIYMCVCAQWLSHV